MPDCGVQLGAAGQDVLQGDAAFLAQGGGLAGDVGADHGLEGRNGRHRSSNPSNRQRWEPMRSQHQAAVSAHRRCPTRNSVAPREVSRQLPPERGEVVPASGQGGDAQGVQTERVGARLGRGGHPGERVRRGRPAGRRWRDDVAALTNEQLDMVGFSQYPYGGGLFGLRGPSSLSPNTGAAPGVVIANSAVSASICSIAAVAAGARRPRRRAVRPAGRVPAGTRPRQTCARACSFS